MEEELATAVLLSPTRDPHKNGEIAQRWMEMVLGEKFRSAFPAVLLSGERLCDLANKVHRALGMSDEVVSEKAETSDGDVATSQAAKQNVSKYLNACESLGVAREDQFQPDDLLQSRDIGKVYRNILALQCVAVSMSSRRSIDERSSLVGIPAPDMSPLSEHGVFDEDSDELDGESASTMNLLQQTRWQRLLFEYEYQLLRQAERDDSESSGSSEGMGQLAHDIWRTEERIRTVIARQDPDYGLVPDDLHGKMWMLTSGAQMEMRKRKGLYERLLAMEGDTSTEATVQIDVDLHRTVANGDKELWSAEKTEMMRRVLVAYSFYNTGLGYCQGLNYIVARSLLFLDEEEAFYLLIKMIRLVPDDYYTSMLGLAVDQHVFADLVRIQLPTVADHLTNLGGTGMDLSLACTEWFLTLFSSPCEREVTIQIWDSIFLFGDELLFRVALALLQLAKDALLKSTVYGDILKYLNALGREELNPTSLMRSARKQDAVIRSRIDEFRAHHRLQLASGIVASSVDPERSQTVSAGRTSAESKTEPKIKQMMKQKKLSRYMDKNAARIARTFDRDLTDEHLEMIRKEDQSVAGYYDGDELVITDNYWGSRASYRQWGSKDIRLVCSSEDSNDADRARMLADTNAPTSRSSAQATRLSGSLGTVHSRERRSKSTAFIQPRKGSNPSIPGDSRSSKEDERDSPLQGRSPKSWLQKRIDDWQKSHKEKKKHDKHRHRQGQRESEHAPSVARSGPIEHSRSSSQLLTGRDALSNGPSQLTAQFRKQSRSSNGTAFDRLKKVNGRQPEPDPTPPPIDVSITREFGISRSFSDPFHSPTDSMRPSSLRDPQRKARHDAINAQILIRSVDAENTTEFESGERDDVSDGKRLSLISDTSGSVAAADRSSDHRISAKSETARMHGTSTRDSSGSQASRNQRKHRHSRKKRSAPDILTTELLDSPVHDRSLSVDLQGDDGDLIRPPQVRRNVSMPLNDPHGHPRRLRNPKRLTSDNARAIRERAHVVSYIHRKASDASSVTGSFPRSPRERSESTRLSTSSSDSSREAILGSNRSARSTHYRKGSFSFFEKLTSDLESYADDLSSAFPDDDDDDFDVERKAKPSGATGSAAPRRQ